MKKTTNQILRKLFFQPALFKSVLLTIAATILLFSAYAGSISSTGSGGNWNAGASWVGGVVPAAGDDVTVVNGATITVTVAAACNNITIAGTLKLNNAGITVSGDWINNGTFTVDQNAAEVIELTGAAATIGGSSTTIFRALTINTTGTITLANTIKIGASSAPYVGDLTLTSGTLLVGAANTIEFIATQGGATITNNGGSIASSGINGIDGGTILFDAQSGGGVLITGSTQTTFYNITFVQNANFNFGASTPNIIINGTFIIPNNNWAWGSNAKSPIYGPASTLSVNRGDQVLPTGAGLEWAAATLPTIGVTPGYPNNVILITTSTSGAWAPTGSRSLNGILTLNSNTRLDLSNVTGDFHAAGIVLNGGSILTAPASANIDITGNWVRASSATFKPNAATAVVFAGPGTSATPQTISVSSGTESEFSNLTLTSNTYVKLLSPVVLPAAGVLSLASGVIETSAANFLDITNTATTAATSGSAISYVNGPLTWSLGTSANSYVYPVGAGSLFLPLTIVPNSTTNASASVQAFNTNSGGSPDHSSINYLDSSKYWSIVTSPGFSTGASISVTVPGAVAPYNMLAKSLTANGVYSSIGGTVGTSAISNSGSIGTASPIFLGLANGPLSLQTVSISYPTCVGTLGAVTVAGSGGTAPYIYANGNGSFTNTTGIFPGLTQGIYIFAVKDAQGIIAYDTVALFPVQASNDTTICSGSAQLSAINHTDANATYSWASIPAGFTSNVANPTVTPTATTTYIVSSLIIDPTNNLITNPDFGAGDNGFTSSYIDLTGNPQIPYTAAGNVGAVGSSNHNGIYAILPVSTGLCQFFTFGPTTGQGGFTDHTTGNGLMMVVDGPSNGSSSTTPIWSQTVSGLALNTTYVFSYWFQNADNNATSAQVLTQINNVSVTASAATLNPYSTSPSGAQGWKKVSYLWNSGSLTSATITLTDLTNADVGNDFAIDDLSMYITCTATDSVTVTVVSSLAAPVAIATQPTCSVATGSITVNSPATGVTYSFDNGATFQSSATSSNLAPATYHVLVKSTTGCISADTAITINAGGGLIAAPVATTTQPTCTVSTGTITVTSPATGVTYSFDNGVTFQAGATSGNLAPNTYQVVVQNAAGCLSVATPEIINAAPLVPAAPVATTTQPSCTVSTGTITVASPESGVTYSFDNGLTFQNNATSGNLNPATYQVVVQSTGGCNSTATAITINAAPVVPAAPVANPTTPTCTVPTGTITVTTPSSGVTYSFDNGATFQNSATSGSLNPGLYQVVVQSAGGCLAGPTPVTIAQSPGLPDVSVSADKLSVAPGGTVNLTGTSSVQGTYLWTASTDAALSDAGSLTTSSKLSKTTLYTLTVTAGDCTGFDTVTVFVINTLPCLHPMKGFTPNSDGHNDKWLVFNNAEGCNIAVAVSVFNRYGGLVYHSDHYNNDWEGKYKDNTLPDGTYYYVITAISTDNGANYQLTGNVTIVR